MKILITGASGFIGSRLRAALLARGHEVSEDGKRLGLDVKALAGLVPAPAGHTLYGASKAFLIKFSEALSNEVQRHNVHVTALCPGFTWSEFHDVTGTREQMKKMPTDDTLFGKGTVREDGRKILEAMQDVLRLSRAELEPSGAGAAAHSFA